jgi:hypothetical protein
MPCNLIGALLVVSMFFVVESALFSCRDDEFECDDGSCIDFKYLCDREDDCPNREDEVGCPKCPKNQFLCSSSHNKSQCITADYVCDSHPDCPDESDERDCSNSGGSSPSTLIPTSSAVSAILCLLILSSACVGSPFIIA